MPRARAPPPEQPSAPPRAAAPPPARSRRAPPTRTSASAECAACERWRGLAEPFVFVVWHRGLRCGGRQRVPHVHRPCPHPSVREVGSTRRRGKLAEYLFPRGQRSLER